MELRKVDISGQAAIDRDGVGAGAVPELRWLPIADLVIDDRFQRPLNSRNWQVIRKIAAEFSWGKFAAVVASPIVGGRYSLIDGQHRAHAAALAGFDTLPAMIVVLSPTDQAGAFAAINGNVTAMSAFHLFKAALAAEAPWALQSRDAVARAGCELMTYHSSSINKRPREVYSVNFVRSHVVAGRADLVTLTLAALAARPDASAEHFTQRVVSPFLAALQGGGARFQKADLAGFCASHDLVKTRDDVTKIAKLPAFRHRSQHDLAEQAFAALLSKFLGGAESLPALVPVLSPEDGEAGLSARMGAVAAAEAKAFKRRGVA